MPKLEQQFFNRKTMTVAKELLGKVLVRKIGSRTLSGIITETEAYVGPHDLASHASKGKTERTSVMFEAAGIWYVYMIYGFYHCLNVVTEEKDYPAAVLIRSLRPLEGIDEMKKLRHTQNIANLANGPGKLCQALGIDRSMNRTSVTAPGARLYIEDRGIKISPRKIMKAKRIGIDYAGEWKDKLLRFHIEEAYARNLMK